LVLPNRALTERGATTKAELDAEVAKDNTTTGNLAYETCLSAMPNSDAKAYAFNKGLDAEVATSVRTALSCRLPTPNSAQTSGSHL